MLHFKQQISAVQCCPPVSVAVEAVENQDENRGHVGGGRRAHRDEWPERPVSRAGAGRRRLHLLQRSP